MGREPLNFTSVFLTLTALVPDGMEPPSIVVDQIVQMANRNPRNEVWAHNSGQMLVTPQGPLHPEFKDSYLFLAGMDGMRTEPFSEHEIGQLKGLYEANSLWGLGGGS